MEYMIQGLETYTDEELKQLCYDYIQQTMIQNQIDAEIVAVEIHGSRARGTARPDSDLDVVVQYRGGIRQDDFFAALNDDPMWIDDVKVDFNPITQDMESYMARSREYDKEVVSGRDFDRIYMECIAAKPRGRGNPEGLE